jgi:hypothetical protein
MRKQRFVKFLRHGHKGQATTELAIAGAIIIMVLAYLIQYGYIYNCRQSLEMYTFRKALQLSREKQRGIALTVIRDVILPSFFTGISRQRLMASANVVYNPYLIYIPWEQDPEDVPTIQLVQINDGMIRNGYFFQVPPTLIKINRNDVDDDEEEPQWGTSSISEFDSQAQLEQKSSQYAYLTNVSENRLYHNMNKQLTSRDIIPTKIIFDRESTTENNYRADDWEGKIDNIEVYAGTIPKDVNMIVDETITKTKNVRTRK